MRNSQHKPRIQFEVTPATVMELDALKKVFPDWTVKQIVLFAVDDLYISEVLNAH